MRAVLPSEFERVIALTRAGGLYVFGGLEGSGTPPTLDHFPKRPWSKGVKIEQPGAAETQTQECMEFLTQQRQSRSNQERSTP